jgi:serine/threonine-protein phosphatase 2A activator
MSESGDSQNQLQAKFKYIQPEKIIKSVPDMAKWEKSEAYYDLFEFINSICMCIQGKSLSFKCHVSPVVQNVLNMLEKFEKLAIETPPVE